MSKKLSSEFSILKIYSENIINLFEEGATIPFVARYRKENTGGMSDVDLRIFFDRWQYLTDLCKRRDRILLILEKGGHASYLIKEKIKKAESKSELEDLYAPFKKVRTTKADEARSKGLQPLAEKVWLSEVGNNVLAIQSWCHREGLNISSKDALKGVESIILESISSDSDVLKKGREILSNKGIMSSRILRGKKQTGEKYQDYFDYNEAVRKIPSHRLLALFRGKKESFLKLNVLLDSWKSYIKVSEFTHLNKMFDQTQPIDNQLSKVQTEYLDLAWESNLGSKVETDVLNDLKNRAEKGAVQVFSDNLEDLLMSAPAGAYRVLGLDPGFRHGVKLAVIDEQGELLDHGVVYLHGDSQEKEEAQRVLLGLISQHEVDWLAIGNGTASRETEILVKSLISDKQLSCHVTVVSEAGASVYSASPVATQEFPHLDVTIRGAISIARRFQDPLAELVKIDPQAIGVGQYQHDVKTSLLSKSLSAVVEDCVNRVGVDVNLASASLLSYVSGLTARLAQNIVDYRQVKGRIESRRELLEVKGIGDKCFEQCAGFIRVLDGQEPLDRSGVHPESYPLVRAMATRLSLSVSDLFDNQFALQKIKLMSPDSSGSAHFTHTDILSELSKPGRDPRPEFRYASFDQTVHKIEDLQEGITLEGVVTNVAAFGAFVDIGVHQDGLIHISQLANRFVKNPRDIVRVGQVVKVTVMEIDLKRKRIALKGNEL
ncbi:RNA-binding transcriptional accessory protein [Marinomonas sp.]|nr:Tex family protein [Marinomonas sp.]MDB4837506.1 RNA-binding transcriptional accessory protein [Marinomonas sp.]